MMSAAMGRRRRTRFEVVMKAYEDKTTLSQMRRDLRYTRGVLLAAGVHEVEQREVQKLFERAKALDGELTDASDAIVDANALVAWRDGVLDRCIGRFGLDALHAAGGDRDELRFKGFFREAPGDYIRLGLESEIEQTAHFQEVAREVVLPKGAQTSLAAVEAARAEGTKAIKARESAVKAEAVLRLRVLRLRDDANAVRRSVYNSLERYAIDKKLEDSYADTFFARAAKKPAKKSAARAKRIDDGNT
jgi:hypothetical protein